MRTHPRDNSVLGTCKKIVVRIVRVSNPERKINKIFEANFLKHE